ncbi:MAG: hypothetical protein ABR562_09760, partial [Thermoplasmatota archaeon]
GRVALDVSRSNPKVVYVQIEAGETGAPVRTAAAEAGAATENTPAGAAAAAFLGCLAGLAAWCGLTMVWSASPDESWAFTNRTLAYVGFALLGVLAGRGRTDRAAAVVATLPRGTVVTRPAAFLADLVINTTTVGETDDATPPAYDLAGAFAPGVRYFDLNHRTSALQTTALTAGCAVLSGALMQRVTNA